MPRSYVNKRLHQNYEYKVKLTFWIASSECLSILLENPNWCAAFSELPMFILNVHVRDLSIGNRYCEILMRYEKFKMKLLN